MPTPGFPDWLGPGAVVIEAATHNRDSTEIRYVVMDVEMELPETTWDGSGVTQGSHVIALMPLVPRDRPPWTVDRAGLHTVNLSAFLDLYQWTGEYLMPDGAVTGVGTTLPITTQMAAVRTGEMVRIMGNPSLDGLYAITSVNFTQGTFGGGMNLRLDALPLPLRAEDALHRLGEAGLGRTGLVHQLLERPGEPVEPARGWEYDLLLAEPAETSPGYEMTALLDEPDATDHHAAEEAEMFPDYAATDFDEEQERVLRDIADTAERILQPGDVIPPTFVDNGQVWLLPNPNEGRWRVTVPDPATGQNPQICRLRLIGSGGLRSTAIFTPANDLVLLVHVRELDRTMRCTPRWLIDHGVRQEPPDPRTNRGPDRQVVLGQIWDIPPATPGVHNIRQWRVHERNDRAGRIVLMAADGSGQRLYWTETQILRRATFIGDGIPRRTSFERILEDNGDE